MEKSRFTESQIVGVLKHVDAGAKVEGVCRAHGMAVNAGPNITIRERGTLGDFILVGAGAAVLDDVPPANKIVGNPARVL